MKKILFALFINITFVIFSSNISQKQNKTMYADIVINEMRTRLALEKKVNDITCYQSVDSQQNTIVHDILIFISKNWVDLKSQKTLIKYNIALLNKLSNHFSEFKDKRNKDEKTPFDIIFEGGRCINIAGSIQNFKDLLPTQKVDIEEKSCQKVKSEKRKNHISMPADSTSMLTSSNEFLKTKLESNSYSDLLYLQRLVYLKKNMGILFEYESLN